MAQLLERTRDPQDGLAETELVEALDSDDVLERTLAIQELRERTGRDFGYDPTARPAHREDAVVQWVEYVTSNEGLVEGSPPDG